MGVTYHMVGVFPALTLRHLDWFELDPSIKTRGMQRFPDHFSSLHRLASLYALMMRRFEEKEKLCSNSSSYSQVGSPQFAKCVSPPSLFSSSSAPLLWMHTSTRFDPLFSFSLSLILILVLLVLVLSVLVLFVLVLVCALVVDAHFHQV